MPKLDLVNAKQIKASAGEWLQAKGQGWSWTKPETGTPTYRAETTAFIDRVNGLAGTPIVGTQAAALDAFYAAAASSTWWPKVDTLYSRFADSIASRVNLKDQNKIAIQSGTGGNLPWSRQFGWAADANNQALDLQINPSAVGSQNSLSLILWYGRLPTTVNGEINDQIGGTSGAIFARFPDTGAARVKLHNTANINLSTGHTVVGFRAISRTGPTTTTVYGASAQQIGSSTTASITPISTSLFLGPGGGGGTTSDAGVLAVGMGSGMTAAEIAGLRAALADLLTAFAT